MTDRHKGFWVALEEDLRDDDIQPLLEAVRRMRGVADVRIDDGTRVTPTDWINRQQLRHGAYMSAIEALHLAIMGEPHPLAAERARREGRGRPS